MPALNVFLTKHTEKTVAFLNRHADAVGCVTIPYGERTEGLDGFYQAVLLPGNELPKDLSQKHPDAAVLLSHQPFDCDTPLIRCCSPEEAAGEFVCFCLSPPDGQNFSPPGLTETWVESVRRGLKHRDPDTVTVELCAGAYAVPFPYDGRFTPYSVSEAMQIARTHGAVLNMNKYSYYSYFIYSDKGCPTVMFLSTVKGVSRMVQQFSELGIKRFALSDTEFSDREMSGLLSLFKK